MFVGCPKCGAYEISPDLFEELSTLPESDWRIQTLSSEIEHTAEPRMICKPSNNIPQFFTVGADKPSKLGKSFLRAKAEGRVITVGTIVRQDSADDKPEK